MRFKRMQFKVITPQSELMYNLVSGNTLSEIDIRKSMNSDTNLNPQEIEVYTNPSAMEPLLPGSGRFELAKLSCDIFREAGKLSGQVSSEIVRCKIARVVREMNSYYSNLIEGHKTLPRDIERALRDDFSKNPEKKDNQYLSVALIQVEGLMKERLQRENINVHSVDFLCWLHREFYNRLPDHLHYSKTKSGVAYKIEPGKIRSFNVDVSRHSPPHHEELPRFLKRFEDFYGNSRIMATNQLIAIAAAHHRMAWIHPFGNGNGRVIRLYSHASLIKNQVDASGLWTLSRGLARYKKNYFDHLEAADRQRYNDYDGRGNLSDRALSNFCKFFLETIIDQIKFMEGLLSLGTLMTRMELYLQREALHIRKHKEELARLLKAALVEGEIPRGRVPEIVGLKETVSREIIKLGMSERLLEAASEKGPLSIPAVSEFVTSR